MDSAIEALRIQYETEIAALLHAFGRPVIVHRVSRGLAGKLIVQRLTAESGDVTYTYSRKDGST